MNDSPSPIGFVAPQPSDLARLLPAYDIHDLIATGGMGAVYLAVQKSLDRTVALKILPMEFSEDAEFCAGFEAEAKAMARLNHPNLIGVHEFGEVNGMLFILMEFVPGKSIFHSANGIAIDPSEVIRLVTGVCNGLAHAHENGILHRDIKPSNILLTPQAEPKIGDFGLARPVERKTQQGEVIFGTPGYTAPEVVDTPHLVDHRADLFSVGVLLHELLTGKLPADDSRPASVISRCDVRFDAIIRRATDPLPANRYASAKEIASELHAITSARVANPIANSPGKANATARRPQPPVRAKAVATKRKSSNLAWIGPLVAVGIAAYSWHTFANRKPRVVVVVSPAAQTEKSQEAESAEAIVSDVGKSSSLPPPEPPAQQYVYLDDLAEMEVKVEYGRLGKHGAGPERSGGPAFVNGIKPEHSLCPHPHQYGTSLVSYALDGKYSTFSGTATVADNSQQRSLKFRIKGDGKSLWQSSVIDTGKDAEDFNLSVAGINKLELEIECPRSAAGAFGMWVNPRLSADKNLVVAGNKQDSFKSQTDEKLANAYIGDWDAQGSSLRIRIENDGSAICFGTIDI